LTAACHQDGDLDFTFGVIRVDLAVAVVERRIDAGGLVDGRHHMRGFEVAGEEIALKAARIDGSQYGRVGYLAPNTPLKA
jgi:hypothetical protein